MPQVNRFGQMGEGREGRDRLRPASSNDRHGYASARRRVANGDGHARRQEEASSAPVYQSPSGVYALVVRKRWFSRRAFLLHFEFFLLASACLVAGWWQVTRALKGNGLSWVYSAEWPGFAVLAVLAWWHLIHEDPEAYRARKQRPSEWEED